MTSIANNLKDPSWWFSAFFIAIIASIIAGFLKDRIENWLGKTFSILKTKRIQSQQKRAELIETLLADKLYFEIALYRTLKAIIIFGISTTMYFSSPLLLSNIPKSPNLTCNTSHIHLAWQFLTVFLGLFNVYIAYRTTKLVSIISEVTTAYRKRNNYRRIY